MPNLVPFLPVIWYHRYIKDPDQAVGFILINRIITALCPRSPLFNTKIRQCITSESFVRNTGNLVYY